MFFRSYKNKFVIWEKYKRESMGEIAFLEKFSTFFIKRIKLLKILLPLCLILNMLNTVLLALTAAVYEYKNILFIVGALICLILSIINVIAIVEYSVNRYAFWLEKSKLYSEELLKLKTVIDLNI